MHSTRSRVPASLGLLGLFAGLQLLFTLLLVLGAAVPDGAVVRPIVQETEPGRTWGLPEGDGVGGSGTPTTDQAVLTSGLGRPELGVWDKAMYMPRLDTGSLGHEQLAELDEDGAVDEELRGYFRYWAGYTFLTRPLLWAWGLSGLRLVVGAVLVTAMWFAARAIARSSSPLHVAAIAAPLLVGTNVVFTPSVSMAHAISFASAFAGLGLLALAGRTLPPMLAATVIGASVYNFVDLLTNPLIPWVLSAALAAGLAYRRSGEVRRLLVHGLAVGIVWPAAWAATWATRWLLAVMSLGRETALADVGGQVQARLDYDHTAVSSSFGAATWRNTLYWWETVATSPFLLVITLGVVVVLALRAARSDELRPIPFLLLCLPVVAVPVWFELFSAHSQIHMAFTYRYLPMMLSVVLFAAVTVWEAHRAEPDVRVRAREAPESRGSAAA